MKAQEEEERPKTPAVEDLKLNEIIQQVQPGNTIKPIQGLLIINQPINED